MRVSVIEIDRNIFREWLIVIVKLLPFVGLRILPIRGEKLLLLIFFFLLLLLLFSVIVKRTIPRIVLFVKACGLAHAGNKVHINL